MRQNNKFVKRDRNEDPNLSRSKILNDKYLKWMYSEILREMLVLGGFNHLPTGTKIVELGSAGGITDDEYGEIETSDIRECTGVQKVINGETLPYSDSSVHLIIAKDVLHHIPNSRKHFSEVDRVLVNGGIIVYAEPNWNFLSRFVFSFLHPEPFLPDSKSWEFESTNPMHSNQALAFMVFKRDVAQFNLEFPNLKLEIHNPINGIAMLLSGGVYKRTKIPSGFLVSLGKLEHKRVLWMKMFGLNRFITLTKETS